MTASMNTDVPLIGPPLLPNRTAVYEHSLSNQHTTNDAELVPLELRHTFRDTIRKAREEYLFDWGQTLETKDINEREEL